MADHTTTFKVAQILGVTASSFLSGFAFSASFLSLPAFALAPRPVRLQQWQKLYDLGKLVSPTTGAASFLIWSYVTYASHKAAPTSTQWQLYSLAGISAVSVIPFTLLVLRPTNNELMKMAKEGKSDKEFAAEGLVDEQLSMWGTLNYVRAALPLIGAFAGLWAIVN